MPVETFLDTNILVYAFDRSAPDKRNRALELTRPDDPGWGISWQIVQEFCSVALHRFATPITASDLREYLELVLLPHCVVHSSPGLYRQAVDVHRLTQYRFYDSLVVASAIHAGASTLFSEDLQHGRVLDELRIANPFRP